MSSMNPREEHELLEAAAGAGGESFPLIQDTGDYTEVDPGDTNITINSATSVSRNTNQQIEAYLYKDFGTNYFNDGFELSVGVSSITFPGSPLTYIASVGDIASTNTNMTHVIAIRSQKLSSTQAAIRVFGNVGGWTVDTGFYTHTIANQIYFKVTWDPNGGTYGRVTFEGFSDAGLTNLLFTKISDLAGAPSSYGLSVLHWVQNRGASVSAAFTDTVHDLQILSVG